MLKRALTPILFTSLLAAPLIGARADTFESDYLLSLYKHLHANPEISFQEEKSSARMAAELKSLGFEVTEKLGGHGVVGVFKNGEGPTVMVRADTDALPVSEQTGLPYASTKTTVDGDGNTVPVMHACGHDMHMTTFVGTARKLVREKNTWSGTLLFIAQPAEERGSGARMMLADGLFEKFPRPDYNLAYHVSPDLPAGSIGYAPEFAMANVDSVDVTFYGIGGHGAYPHRTKDPIVLAAHFITAVQTLVSREVEPIDAGVVTVGSIHGGTKHNIIPAEVKLQLTVRSYSDETRQSLLEGIKRVALGQAVSVGMPDDKMPLISIKDEYTPALYNNPELTERVIEAIKPVVGSENIIQIKPVMGGEDFSRYGRVEPKIPSFMLRLGVISQADYEATKKGTKSMPSLHSPFFAPLPEPSITTGVNAMTAAVKDLMNN